MKLLHFTAEWCNPCKRIKPIIEQYIQENPEIEYITIDVDSNLDAVKEWSVMSVPTLIAVGEETKRHTGVITSEQLKDLLTN
jgi:thioredoxin 1